MVPPLHTERLVLQQILPDDQEFIFRGLSHPDVIRFYGVRYDSYDSTSIQMDWYRQMLREGSGIPWKIVDKINGERIGVIAVYNFKPEHRKAEIGFWIMPKFWSRGYGAEAIRAVLDYWQQEKKIHRMEAFVETGNQASGKVLLKTGFVLEGIMNECEIKDGKFISLEIYGKILDL